MQIIQSIDLIAIDEKVRRGRPYIMGTSITVADIAIVKIYHGQDADGIAAWYDLTLSQVYAALAYYYEHKEEIDEQIRHQIKRSEMFEEGFLPVSDRHLSSLTSIELGFEGYAGWMRVIF